MLMITWTRVCGHDFTGERPVPREWTFDTTAAESVRRPGFRTSERRVLAMSSGASPSVPLASVSEKRMTVLCPELFASGDTVLPVLVHTAPPPFQSVDKVKNCRSVIRRLVFHPNGSEFYYILDENCFSNDTLLSKRMSLRKAVLGRIHSTDDHPVLSYWWRFAEGSGPRENSSFIWTSVDHANISMETLYSLDVTKLGDHLVMVARSGNKEANIVSMSLSDGYRTSVPVPAVWPESLALNPEKTRLYLADVCPPLRLLSVAATDSALPVERAEWTTVRIFGVNSEPNISRVIFTPQSFVFAETCLYFIDDTTDRVWGIDISSSSDPRPVAGSGQKGSIDGDGFSSSFRSLKDVVTTPDGCNVFVADYYYGLIRWLKLDSPCSTARGVETVARYTELSALALHQSADELSLYVGASDGSVFELKINSSKLQTCASPPDSPPSFSSPPSSSAAGFSSPPPQDSFTSPSSSRSSSIKRRLALVIALPLSASALLGLGACLYCWTCRQRDGPLWSSTRRTGRANVTEPPELRSGVPLRREERDLHLTQVKQFSLATLSGCTDNFSQSYRIGASGAFGDVYWGSIDDKELAIKVMTGDLTEGKRSMFVKEVNTLSRLHHANLIELVGYCDEGNLSILVYPYFQGGSLDARLHDREKAVPGEPCLPPLTLVERMCVAWQIAKGLSYLHDGANPPIIHRDIKSSNVLLGGGSGANLHVVVADFGIATIGDRVLGTGHDTVVKTSHMAGTFGYMAPEYVRNGILSEKNDVYAFGVIVLELLTGRKAVTQAPSESRWQTLMDWAKPFLGSESLAANVLYEILDPCLRDQAAGSTCEDMVKEALQLASKCLVVDPEARPTMSGLAGRIGEMLVEASRHTQDIMII
ncbi:hypothetical protein CBR_g51365 [Chara braunii]|uniref:Protein kinase domain-containing protein n=1 Tax=Chara braunii TaxID=69332 RepID=A0A388M8R7_CHABU|nr:hypothetical protein CBR_g51365 [Chara braunii]|eukprot:GBG90859.1 hypothetical protein CBR_g51365 [Chara braunii]